MDIKFNDLKPQHKLLKSEIENAVNKVLRSGWYVLGPEVEMFENEFAQFHKIKYAVGVANGTDAIELSLRALGVGPGDEVITTSLTAVATVCAIERTGAIPKLVDIEESTYTIDPQAVDSAITSRTKAIVPVHLYGHPANMLELVKLAKQNNLYLIEDCAQSHGAMINDRLVGTFGDISAFSFYPTKNLSAYGDAGAILTNSKKLESKVRKIRNYGQKNRYEHVEKGINSRIDEVQAAILRVKLKYLKKFNKERRSIAKLYNKGLFNLITPQEKRNYYHVYHLYVVRSKKRDILQNKLLEKGVETLIHYPKPVHLQRAYLNLGLRKGSLPVTEQVSKEILSLPLYYGFNKAKSVRNIINSLQT